MADGSIVLEAKIDDESAQKELDRLNREIGKLKTKAENIAAKRTPLVQDLEAARKEAINTYNEVERLQNALKSSQAKTSIDGGVSPEMFMEEKLLQERLTAELTEQQKILKQKEAAAQRLEERDRKLVAQEERITAEMRKQEEAAGEIERQLIKSSTGALRKMKTAAEGVTEGFNKGLKSLLKYGLGIRSLYVLANVLRRSLVEGFQELVKYDAETNASISAVVSSLSTLKNSLATAFAPIVNVVAPILAQFIDMLATAISYVGMFFSVMTGKTTYTKAIAVQKDYAASLEGTASAAGSAAEAIKNLSGLDEIKTFEEATSGGGGGVSSGASDSGALFEEVEIPEAFQNGFWGSLALNIKDVLFNWKNLNGEDIAQKAITGLSALAGGVIGFAIGGVPGAIVGTLTGLVLGLVASDLMLDNDGVLSKKEIQGLLRSGLSALVGGVIGFAIGGPGGALLGLSVGVGVSLILESLDFESKVMDWLFGTETEYATFTKTEIPVATEISPSAKTQAQNYRKAFERSMNRPLVIGDELENGGDVLYEGMEKEWDDSKTTLYTKNLLEKTGAQLNRQQTAEWNQSKTTLTSANKLEKTGAALVSQQTAEWNQSKTTLTSSNKLENSAKVLSAGFSKEWLGNVPKAMIVNELKYSGYELWKTFYNGWAGRKLSISVDFTSNMTSTQKAVARALGLSGWPTLRFAARGGIVDAATLFGNTIVGEAGKEAIVPLERHTEWLDLVAGRLADLLSNAKGGIFDGVSAGLDNVAAAINRMTATMPNLEIAMPAMASGAVVPPGLLSGGDGLSDVITELKDTLASLRGEEGGNRFYSFTATLNRRTLFREIIDEARLQQGQTGVNPFDL